MLQYGPANQVASEELLNKSCRCSSLAHTVEETFNLKISRFSYQLQVLFV